MWCKRYLETWFVLPVFSALLLIVSFHPFNFWPLGFLALAPLFYFVSAFPDRSGREVFLGGFLTGVLFAGSVCFFTVIQFHWLPETYLFVFLVRMLFIPIALIGGVQWGFILLGYRWMQRCSILSRISIGAALYTTSEMVLYAVFGGYHFALLAYVGVSVTPLISLAAVGGVFLVSFIIAFVNILIAEIALHGRAVWRTLLVFFAVLILIYAGNMWYLHSGDVVENFSVALVQVGDKNMVTTGSVKEGFFNFPELGAFLAQADTARPDLLIYPFSPVDGALYRGAPDAFNKPILAASEPQFGSWLKGYVSSSTTVMFWNTLYESGRFYNDFAFWKNGLLVGEYRKRKLFPFLDYTPSWAARMGLYSTNIDLSKGEQEQSLVIGGVSIGALLCSEIQLQHLARFDAARAPLIISAGSEAVFVDDVASQYSLKAARFRAVENNIPVVRANVLGPSAIVASNGSIVVQLKGGERAVAVGTLEIRDTKPTLYQRWGNTIMFSALILLFVLVFVRRCKYILHWRV